MHTTAATQCGVDNGGSCSKALQVLLFVVVVVVVIMAMLEVLPMAGAASTVLQWVRSLASVAWYRLCARATSVCCMLVQKGACTSVHMCGNLPQQLDTDCVEGACCETMRHVPCVSRQPLLKLTSSLQCHITRRAAGYHSKGAALAKQGQ
jgi:hypothetical protein